MQKFVSKYNCFYSDQTFLSLYAIIELNLVISHITASAEMKMASVSDFTDSQYDITFLECCMHFSLHEITYVADAFPTCYSVLFPNSSVSSLTVMVKSASILILFQNFFTNLTHWKSHPSNLSHRGVTCIYLSPSYSQDGLFSVFDLYAFFFMIFQGRFLRLNLIKIRWPWFRGNTENFSKSDDLDLPFYYLSHKRIENRKFETRV